MKKILFVISFIVCLCCLSVNSFAASVEDYPIMNLGLGTNLLDPDYIVKNDDNSLSYDAWIPVDCKSTYYFCFANVISNSNACSLILEFDGINDTKKVNFGDLKADVKLDFSSYDFDFNYFRVKRFLDQDFEECYTLDYIKNNTYLNKGQIYSYSPYYYSNDYANSKTSKNCTIVTSSDYKVDLDNVKKSFVTKDNAGIKSIEVYDDGGYLDKYTTYGTYNVVYRVTDTSGNYVDTTVYIIVFKDDTPVISGPDEITISISEGLTDVKTTTDYYNSLYTFTYGSRKTSLRYQLYDNSDFSGDCKDIAEVLENPGDYYLKLSGLYKEPNTTGGSRKTILEKTVVIHIVDDIDPEVYLPNAYISLTDAKSATNEELCQYLKQMLEIGGILVTDVNVVSTDYIGSEKTAGNYDINYSYSVDGIEYLSKASIVVSKSDESLTDVLTAETSTGLSYLDIICISIISLMCLAFASYMIKGKIKTNKKL